MLLQSVNNAYCLFLDIYVDLEGKWYVEYATLDMIHDSLRMAEKYCSNTANCFGIVDYLNSLYSVAFPFRLTKERSDWIHKKETMSGNLH